ncbi:MAG: hypothetical protein QXZ17_05635 [Nitrososphaerota archaeon]
MPAILGVTTYLVGALTEAYKSMPERKESSLRDEIIAKATSGGKYPTRTYNVLQGLTITVYTSKPLEIREFWLQQPFEFLGFKIGGVRATNCASPPQYERSAYEKYWGWRNGFDIHRVCVNDQWYLVKFATEIDKDQTKEIEKRVSLKASWMNFSPTVEFDFEVNFSETLYVVLAINRISSGVFGIGLYVNDNYVTDVKWDTPSGTIFDITPFVRSGKNTVRFVGPTLSGFEVDVTVKARGVEAVGGGTAPSPLVITLTPQQQTPTPTQSPAIPFIPSQTTSTAEKPDVFTFLDKLLNLVPLILILIVAVYVLRLLVPIFEERR